MHVSAATFARADGVSVEAACWHHSRPIERFSVRYRLTNSQTLEITTDPSPTEEATRLTDPARTSPTAKTPGSEVAKGEAGEPSPEPVITKPFLSRFTRPAQTSRLARCFPLDTDSHIQPLVTPICM